MLKKCIIIDNEDQSEEIEKLIRDAKKRGITIECEQFNVGSTFETDLLTDGKIDITKVVAEYRKRFNGKTFHFAAFDWDLSDENIDGVELVRQLRANKILKNTPKILYSGLLDHTLESMIDDYTNKKFNKQDLIKRVKTLLNAGIKKFVHRDNYDVEIIGLLENSEDNLDLIIEEELNKFPDLTFANKFINQDFNGKTFKEIASKLEEYDHMRNDFKREIILQVIAHLTEII